jgi:hypothetical protein
MYTLVTDHSNTCKVLILTYLLILTIEFNMGKNLNMNNTGIYIYLIKI